MDLNKINRKSVTEKNVQVGAHQDYKDEKPSGIKKDNIKEEFEAQIPSSYKKDQVFLKN